MKKTRAICCEHGARSLPGVIADAMTMRERRLARTVLSW
jgi:hypothetical protein